jgi:hypothetical protein
MPSTENTAPLSPHERAAAARALEAVAEALDPARLARLDAATVWTLIGTVRGYAISMALDLRQGGRAAAIDRQVGSLDRDVARLVADAGE